MRASDRPGSSERGTAGVAIIAGLWLLLTIGLGAIVIYTDMSLEGLIGLHLDIGYAFLGAIIIGFLMGSMIERTRILIVMVVLSCVGAVGLFVGLLYIPVWTGNLVGTVGLENFATTRALLYFGLTIVPTSIGALVGRLLGGMLPGGNLLAGQPERTSDGWWLDRSANRDTETELR